MRSDGLSDLAAISAMVRDRDLAAVESIVARMREIESDIGRLRDLQDQRLRQDVLDPARLSGRDPVWLKWSEERLAGLTGELARLKAEHDTALRAARRSFGRAEVAKTLFGRLPKGTGKTQG